MRSRSGLILALAAGIALSGCAAGAAGPSGPVTSPTGKTYAPGTRPTESRFTTPAKLFIAQAQWQRALEQAQQGIQADSTNPQHYFIAGQAYAGLGDIEQANEMFARAEQIYPAYELEIEPVREQAWAEAFNRGVTAYNAGNMEEAVREWDNANAIYPLRGEAYQNLAAIHTQASDWDKAIATYRAGIEALGRTPATRELTAEETQERAEALATMQQNLAELLLFTDQFAEAERLFRQQLQADSTNITLQARLASAIASQPGREAEAQQIYNRLLSQPNLPVQELTDIGVALFQGKDYARAAEAFKRVSEQRPNSRDIWYNYSNALYAGENWQPLVGVGERLVQLDPLNEDAALILARAYRDTQQNAKALAELERIDRVPVKVGQLEMRRGQGRVTIAGQAIGNRAPANSPVQLRFTFYGEDGQALGTQNVTVNAPAKDATAPFQVEFETEAPVVGYKYELVR